MATKKKPTKRPASTSRHRKRSKALRASGSHLRTSTARQPDGPASNGFLMAGPMGRAFAAYAELPGRLIACTSPVQFWAEYLRFGQRLLGGFQGFPSPEPDTGSAGKRDSTTRRRGQQAR
jgi:hypothetical protein